MSFSEIWIYSQPVRATIVIGRNNKATRFRQAINEIDPNEMEAEVERAWVTALWDDQVSDSMHTTASKDE